MAKKKKSPRKKTAARKKPALKKKSAPKKKPAAKKKLARRNIRAASARGTSQIAHPFEPQNRRGLGSDSAGQSGDTQKLSRTEDVDSESVEELVEDGQDFEAEAVSGVENAKDPDQGEVTTREVPEDDVPLEYTEPDED
jgi:hypothetical protein